MKSSQEQWINQALSLAIENVRSGRGGPFGALVVKENRLIASGTNLVTLENDPSAHAEIVAMRAACRKLGSFQLDGCEIYASCEPCPMCLGAIFWARADRFYFASTRIDAARAGFDDAFIYDQIHTTPAERFIPGYFYSSGRGLAPFAEWAKSTHRIPY
jgi:tRNA(Arg) A34 adenosine deaminase TadA